MARDPGTRDRTFWTAPDGSRADDLVARATAEALDVLATPDRQVLLIEPLPYGRFDPTDCLSSAATVGECAYTAATGPFASESAYRAQAALRANVTSVDADHLACPLLPTCIPVLDGRLVFFNQYHLDAGWLDAHRDEVWAWLAGAVGA